MEPLARLDSKSILSEEIFLEIFEQEDEIVKARMILSLTDRAGELGVKKKFEELLKAYKRVDKEAKQRERKKPITMLDKWTNFEGPYNNMFCGAWIAGEDGVYAQNDSQVDAVACYHPILPVERMKNLETGEEQIKILTNGERPLNSYVSQGGAINRILEVECKDNVYADPQETAEIVKKNYGLAGKRYIEVLKGIGKEKLHQMQKEFMQELKDDEAIFL